MLFSTLTASDWLKPFWRAGDSGGSNSRRYVWLSVGNLPGVSEPSLSSITIYQFRVVLCGVSPLVWRRFLLANDTTLAQLHQNLHSAFDLSGGHLHRLPI